MRENFRGTRIAIIEDEFIIANDLQNILQRLGYEVVGIADSYDTAVQLLSTKSVDLALIDIILKGKKSGIDLAHAIRSSWRLPFIFVTSHTDESTLQKAKSSDPYGYIVKPFEEREILASIEIALYKNENENISRQEFEKNLLLEISKSLAGAETKQEILSAVEKGLGGILPGIACVSIVLSSADTKEIVYYLADCHQDKGMEMSNPSEDAFLRYVVKPGDLRELVIREAAEEMPDSLVLKTLQEREVAKGVLLPIAVTGGRFGTVTLLFQGEVDTAPHRRVLAGVAELLSMSISKMISDEEIQRSQSLQSIQLDLANALDNKLTISDQLLHVAKVLRTPLPFDAIALYALLPNERRVFVFNRVGFEEFQVLEESQLMNVLQVRESQLQGLLAPSDLQTDVQVVDAASLRRQDTGAIRQQFLEKYGVASILQIPIEQSTAPSYCLEVYSRTPAHFDKTHEHVAQRLRSTLRLLLENIFAFDEINSLTDQLQNEKQYLIEELESTYRPDGMSSQSIEMQRVIARIETVAQTDTSVLIQGETGTGKELTARAIHRNSKRADKPFIKVNCAAIPAQLIESELFGHEKGAFTGAHDRRIGKFELANHGTLFLDEIGEMPLELQPKLLRAIQEGEFERLGSNKLLNSDIRLISATNRNLSQEIGRGNFRADLFYRISVFPIDLPPLRNRVEDIAPLALGFGKEICGEQGSQFVGFDEATMENFKFYRWPGNIRELRNVVEQLCILYRNRVMHWQRPGGVGDSVEYTAADPTAPLDLKSNIQQTERQNILKALRQAAGRIRGDNGAAAMLGIKPTTLEYRIKKLNIKKEEIFE